MKTMITARHCDIPDELRERATALMQKLGKMAHRPQRAEIVFDEDHQRKVVELRMFLPRGQTHVASAEATDFRTALDRAVEKLRPQLDKKGGRTARRERTA